MQLSDEQKKQLVTIALTALVVLIIQVAGVFGIDVVYPKLQAWLNPAPEFSAAGFGIQPAQTFKSVRATQFIQNDGTLTQTGAATFTGAATLGTAGITTANITTANITAGTITTATVTSLSLGGQTQSGAVRYGTAATYTSGGSITHGFSVTPTVCVVFPNQSVTATLTITATGFSSNMASTASPIYWMCGK